MGRRKKSARRPRDFPPRVRRRAPPRSNARSSEPIPIPFGFVEKKCVKIFSGSFPGSPGPRSRTLTSTNPSEVEVEITRRGSDRRLVHRFEGIHDEVEQDLLQMNRVRLHVGKIAARVVSTVVARPSKSECKRRRTWTMISFKLTAHRRSFAFRTK